MPRRIHNDGQEITFQALSKITPWLEKELYERVIFEMVQRVENAFFSDSMDVSYVGPTTVNVNSGVGFQTDNTQTGAESKKRVVYLDADMQKTLTTPDLTFDRIDVICIKSDRYVSGTESGKFKDALLLTISTVTFDVETDWTNDIQVVTGTPAGVPVAPAVPAGYIKLAECYVNAVTGLSGPGDITDFRTKLPLAGDALLNTVGFDRLTAGVSVPLSTLLGDADALLKRGYQEYTDYDVLAANPSGDPALNKARIYNVLGNWFSEDDTGAVTPLGAGGGGGGGSAAWYPEPGNAPVEDTENGEKVWLFEQGQTQELNLFVKVPNTYIAGRPISMRIALYSPSAANTILLQSTATLVRKNLDAIDSVANNHPSGNSALTNTVANQYRETELELTTIAGLVNGFAVSPGDILKVALTRGTDTDTADIRFVPSGTELDFA